MSFKVGDKVLCRDNSTCEFELSQGQVYEVTEAWATALGDHFVRVAGGANPESAYLEDRFEELLSVGTSEDSPTQAEPAVAVEGAGCSSCNSLRPGELCSANYAAGRGSCANCGRNLSDPVPDGPIISLAALAGDAKARKNIPIYSGCIKYFPDALAAVAQLSRIGNEQHNPGKPLRWDRSKSGDELDALSRHLVQAGTIDTDGVRHSTKVAWRALANLQKEIEGELLLHKVRS